MSDLSSVKPPALADAVRRCPCCQERGELCSYHAKRKAGLCGPAPQDERRGKSGPVPGPGLSDEQVRERNRIYKQQERARKREATATWEVPS